MQENKAIQIIRTFTSRERTALKAFIGSPYFNQSENVKVLCYALLDETEHNPDVIDLDALLNHLNSLHDTAIDKGHMNVLLTQLNKKLELFLKVEMLKSKPQQSELFLLEFMHDRNLGSLFSKRFKKTARRFENYPENTNKYYRLFRLYRLLSFHQRLIDQENEEHPYRGERQVSYFDVYTYIEYLKRIIALLADINPGKAPPLSQQERDTLLKNMSAGYLEHNLLVRLYHMGIVLFWYPENTDHYYTFKQQVFKHAESIDPAELHELLQCALGYCYRKNIRGEGKVFNPEAYEISQYIIDEGILHYKTYIDHLTFRNLVLNYCNGRQFKAAKKLIRELSPKLNPNQRENLVNYNLGIVHHKAGDNDKAMQYFSKISGRMPFFSELSYRLAASSIYYQREETTLLLSHLKSMQNYIYRHTYISSEYKEYLLNFVKYTRRLVKAQSQHELEKLKQQVMDNKVNNANWILKRIEDKARTLRR